MPFYYYYFIYRYIDSGDRGEGRCGIQKQIWITVKKISLLLDYHFNLITMHTFNFINN